MGMQGQVGLGSRAMKGVNRQRKMVFVVVLHPNNIYQLVTVCTPGSFIVLPR